MLRHPFRNRVSDVSDESSGKDEAIFHQAVLNQVVRPLQDDLQSFLGTRAV